MVENNKLDILDELIEKALREERLVPPPVTLHSKVMKRVQLQQLREREEKQFRYLMSGFAITVITIVFATIFSIAFYKWSVMFWYGTDAGRGYWDYYRTTLQSLWTQYQGSYSFIGTVLIAISTLILAFTPWLKSPKA